MLDRIRSRVRTTQEESEGGFTLIELLVVMIIIGILAAIAIPAFLSQKKKGYEASEKADLRSIATEIATQLVDNPDTIAVTGAAGVVNITPTTNAVAGAAGVVNLSPGNALGANSVVQASNGAYCIALTNNKGGDGWKISNFSGAIASATPGAQVLARGAC